MGSKINGVLFLRGPRVRLETYLCDAVTLTAKITGDDSWIWQFFHGVYWINLGNKKTIWKSGFGMVRDQVPARSKLSVSGSDD